MPKPCCRGVTGAGHPCTRGAGANGYCATHARSARRNATARASSAARKEEQDRLFAEAEKEMGPASANMATLGITKANYTLSEVKRAYKKMALEKHPDKAGGSHNAFLKLRAAYKALRRTLKKSSSSSSE